MKTKLGRPLPGRRVHFVGIGGVGMASLAELLHALDYEISGSDLKPSRPVQRLIGMGIPVTVGAHRAQAAAGADHVIVSAAVPADNVEVLAAQAEGAEVVSRARLLGRIFDAGRGVAVAGTHGKTTTSSMLARALGAAGFEPSFLIGGDINDVGSGAGLGTSDLVVAEADEFSGSFLELSPELAIVTNVDRDHLDFFEDQAAIDRAFLQFLDGRREGGTAVLCATDEGVDRIRARIAAPVVTYGFADADLVVDGGGEVVWHGRSVGRLRLSVPGRHNMLNAAGATAAAFALGADPAAVLDGLRGFSGVDRRFSVRGEAAGVVVVDDYAHNPRKIAAAVDAARSAYVGRRLVVLFQPHLYSRTLTLAEEFGAAFDGADVVVITDVYGSREEPIPGVSGRLVSDVVRERGSVPTVVYIPRLEEAAGFVAGLTERGDVVVTMGAGDVTTAAPRILKLIETPKTAGAT
ncbi:MAG TPA: UDP-N-acetylmuramate--L-alanine ligase [Actinomycetota bacterium]|nr:UDP-N-acetylmuramate--L-alanine ligase [Actinomycetota bacterium]